MSDCQVFAITTDGAEIPMRRDGDGWTTGKMEAPVTIRHLEVELTGFKARFAWTPWYGPVPATLYMGQSLNLADIPVR